MRAFTGLLVPKPGTRTTSAISIGCLIAAIVQKKIDLELLVTVVSLAVLASIKHRQNSDTQSVRTTDASGLKMAPSLSSSLENMLPALLSVIKPDLEVIFPRGTSLHQLEYRIS